MVAHGGMKKMALLFFVLSLVAFAHEAQGRSFWRGLSVDETDSEIERQLKILNKPAVKSFQTEYGVIFDCVDIHKQPAFDNPLLKNHTLQTELSSDAKAFFKNTSKGAAHRNTGMELECPPGTVIIRRTTKEDLLTANYSTNIYAPQFRATSYKSHFGLLMFEREKEKLEDKYYGGQALMDVYQTFIERSQITAGLISLINGLHGPEKSLNLFQFGWHLYPTVNDNDYNPHFFTQWTSDGFNETGCLNMRCPGYVQVSTRLTPGMVLKTGRAAIKLSVYKDRVTRNWVLVQDDADHEMLGYFPIDLFTDMDAASVIQIGGAVSSVGDVSPAMGSGVRPYETGACEFKQVALQHSENLTVFTPPLDAVKIVADKPEVYGVGGAGLYGPENRYMFMFGGPYTFWNS